MYVLRTGPGRRGREVRRQSHGGTRPVPPRTFVHVSCMLERTDRRAKGYTDPRPCVMCSREGAGRRRPPHRTELARGLPMNESEGR